jgi:protein-ribulosamine 3-kinase
MTDSSIWNEEVAISEAVISYVDPNVEKSEYVVSKSIIWVGNGCSLTMAPELPQGLTIEGISPHGASYWTRTAHIRAVDQNGEAVSYFLKVNI